MVSKGKYVLLIVILYTMFFGVTPGFALGYLPDNQREFEDIPEVSYSKYLFASVSGVFKDIFGRKKKDSGKEDSVSSPLNDKEKAKDGGRIIYSYDKKELEKIISEEKERVKEDLSRYEGQAKEAFDLAKQAEDKYGQLKKDFDAIKSSGLKIDGLENLRSEILGIKSEAESIANKISAEKKDQSGKQDNSAEVAALRAEIQNMNTNLINKINLLSTQTSNQNSAVYRTISLTNKIDQLSGVTISNATVSGVSGLTDSDIPDNLTAADYLPLTGGTLSGTLSVNANILQQASSYLNFGTSEGGSGYGFRDSGGKIQIKNSGGNWVNVSTASTTIVNQYASGGAGTQASPWTGWESSVNNLPENSEIFFPAGYYRLSSPIIVKAGWRISGAGVDSTRITLADGVNDSILKSASDPVSGSYVWNLTIQDLYLDGNKANNSSGKGVYGSFWHLKIYRTKFKNFAENGINLIAGAAGEIWENFLIDVYVEASGGDNVKIETGVNDGEIIRLISRDSAVNGIHLNSVGGWKITNSHFYYNQVGVRLKDSSKTTVNNSEIETNKTIGLQINGSGGNQVVGNSFYRNSCPSISSNVCSGYGSYSHVTVEWSNNNGIVGNNFYKYNSEPNFTKYIIEEQGTSNSNYISDNTYLGYATGDFLKVGSNTVFNSNFNGVTNSVRGIFSDVAVGTTSPQRKLHVYRSDDGAPVRFEDVNGYCEIDPTSTSWTCTSDRSLKKDISNLASSDSLSRLSLLQAVNFRWFNQDSGDLRYGLIAQDVESVFPDFVKTDERGIKTVNYGGFTPIIIDAIKELNLKVNDLESACAGNLSSASSSSVSFASSSESSSSSSSSETLSSSSSSSFSSSSSLSSSLSEDQSVFSSPSSSSGI